MPVNHRPGHAHLADWPANHRSGHVVIGSRSHAHIRVRVRVRVRARLRVRCHYAQQGSSLCRVRARLRSFIGSAVSIQ